VADVARPVGITRKQAQAAFRAQEIQMSKGTVLVIGSNATELEAQGGGTIKIRQFLNETAVPLMTLVAPATISSSLLRPARNRLWIGTPTPGTTSPTTQLINCAEDHLGFTRDATGYSSRLRSWRLAWSSSGSTGPHWHRRPPPTGSTFPTWAPPLLREYPRPLGASGRNVRKW